MEEYGGGSFLQDAVPVVGVSESVILSAVSVFTALRTTLSLVLEAAESAPPGLLHGQRGLEKSFRKHIHGNVWDVVGGFERA